MGNSKWPVSQSKPDWTDIIALMKAIEKMHDVLVTLCVTPGGFVGPQGYITFSAYHVPGEASVLGQAILAMSGEFPCPVHGDLATCAFAGLYQFDEELCAKLWQQSKLPFTQEGPSA